MGINTGNPDRIAFETISAGMIKELEGYSTVKREVKFGDSRFDIFAENENEKCFVEVKNVTLKEGNYALFPDTVTIRGRKHLKTLIEVKQEGIRAVMLYIIQRIDVDIFAPAKEIDPLLTTIHTHYESLFRNEGQNITYIKFQLNNSRILEEPPDPEE